MIRKDQVSRALKDPRWAGRAVLLRIKGRIKRLPPTPSAVARQARRHRPLSALDRSRCLICGSPNLKVYDIERPTRHYDVRICGRCRYVSNAENTVDYTKFQSLDKFALTPRVGTDDHRGREFHMAKMGAEILKRKRLSVMVFGAGRSLDYRHIAKLPSVNKVIMSDVVDLRGEADFINITKGTDQRFDLIIACEVVEHFTDPRTEFPRLFDLLTPDGLLVCSTNIYDGGHPDRHSYLYRPRSRVVLQPALDRRDRKAEQHAVRLPDAEVRPPAECSASASATSCSATRWRTCARWPSTSAATPSHRPRSRGRRPRLTATARLREQRPSPALARPHDRAPDREVGWSICGDLSGTLGPCHGASKGPYRHTRRTP